MMDDILPRNTTPTHIKDIIYRESTNVLTARHLAPTTMHCLTSSVLRM